MSSGVRVTVALIVIAFVAIGLYYAGLEGDLPSNAIETSGDGLVRSDDIETAEPVLVGDDLQGSAPVLSIPETVDPVVIEPQEVELVEVVPEDRSPIDVPLEVSPEPIGSETADASEEQTPDVSGEVMVAEEPMVDDASRSMPLPVRGAVMVLLADPFEGDFESAEVIENFTAGNVVPPPGTTWVPIEDWVDVPPGEPAPWITVEDGDVTRLLVRDTVDSRVELDGEVHGAGERLDTLRGTSLITFVLKDDGARAMRDFTFPNLGREFALMIDGEVVMVQLIRTAMETRGTLLPPCDRPRSQWIAARFAGDPAEKPAPPASDDAVDQEVAAEEVATEKPAARGASTFGTWTVRQGDTFISIAEEWFGDKSKWTLIANANPGVDSSDLDIGQKLRIPPRDSVLQVDVADGGVHVVASGENLSQISQAYYGKAKYWRKIYEANRQLIGDSPEDLEVGMKLVMPRIED